LKEKENMVHMFPSKKLLKTGLYSGTVNTKLILNSFLQLADVCWLLNFLIQIRCVLCRFSDNKLCGYSEPRTTYCTTRSSCHRLHGTSFCILQVFSISFCGSMVSFRFGLIQVWVSTQLGVEI
jgi:hypothetical protein